MKHAASSVWRFLRRWYPGPKGLGLIEAILCGWRRIPTGWRILGRKAWASLKRAQKAAKAPVLAGILGRKAWASLKPFVRVTPEIPARSILGRKAWASLKRIFVTRRFTILVCILGRKAWASLKRVGGVDLVKLLAGILGRKAWASLKPMLSTKGRSPDARYPGPKGLGLIEALHSLHRECLPE